MIVKRNNHWKLMQSMAGRGWLATLGFLLTMESSVSAQTAVLSQESDYYTIETFAAPDATVSSRATLWRPNRDSRLPDPQLPNKKLQTTTPDATVTGMPDDLFLEVSGMAWLPDSSGDSLAVAIRKGEVWRIDGAVQRSASQAVFRRLASGLHEPLGLVHAGASSENQVDLITVQRGEVTRLVDRDGDGLVDEYRTLADGWGVTGHYHEYAYGPVLDQQGSLWLSLNVGLNLKPDQHKHTVYQAGLDVRQGLWRGWGLRLMDWNAEHVKPTLQPVCAGMRSPCGLGMNLAGDVFYTDQQGNWVATGSLHHMQTGAFFHHPESLASMDQPDSPIRDVRQIPAGQLIPEAAAEMPAMRPPAIWFPYKEMGQSATDIQVDRSKGGFGPFAGQLFVGEFTQASINRVFLERVDGQYQGACFPFLSGFASAVLRLAQANDGTMMVGLSNRGWSSLGSASFGLQRIKWTGEVPFEIKEMRAKPDGFELTTTRPVAAVSATPDAFQLDSYTYRYHKDYGSDRFEVKELPIVGVKVSDDGRRVRLRVDGLRKHFVHALTASGLRDEAGHPLLHDRAYYTLNAIPSGSQVQPSTETIGDDKTPRPKKEVASSPSETR
ncbi:MAG: hypothetical protein AAGD07_02875 [Planctomycetota bacterium]